MEECFFTSATTCCSIKSGHPQESDSFVRHFYVSVLLPHQHLAGSSFLFQTGRLYTKTLLVSQVDKLPAIIL